MKQNIGTGEIIGSFSFLTIISILVIISTWCGVILIRNEMKKYDYVCVEYQTVYVSEPNRRFGRSYHPTYTTRSEQKCTEWKKVKKTIDKAN